MRPAPASPQTRDLTPVELADPYQRITPRYWVPAADVQERLAGRWAREWLLGFRGITNVTNERTAIFSLLPLAAFGNSVPITTLEGGAVLACCLISCLSSIAFDFVARNKVGGTNFNFFIVNQLPVLPPDAFTDADMAYIVPRVVELVYTAWDMQAFAEDVWNEADAGMREVLRGRWEEQSEEQRNRGTEEQPEPLRPSAFASNSPSAAPFPPFRWNETRRAVIRAELDARIAKLYGLTRDELCYILDPSDVHGPEFPGETFRVLKEKETKLYGEYRTARLVLAAWDRG